MYLVGALAELTTSHSELPPLIPLMVKATQVRTYDEHYTLRETLCKIIPALAKGIGKRPFKEFLNPLFEPIFYTVVSFIALSIRCHMGFGVWRTQIYRRYSVFI